MCEQSDLRIVLLGKVGRQKTSVKDIILSSSEENEKPASECQNSSLRETVKCLKENVKIGGRNMLIVDTPGLCSAEEENDEVVIKKIKESVFVAGRGPHVFLFVLKLASFTEEDQEMVDNIKTAFGKEVTDYMMALLTYEGQPTDPERLIKPDLKKFVDECKGGYYVINTGPNAPQVPELLQRINTLIQENKGKFYAISILPEKRATVLKKVTLSVLGSAAAGAGLGTGASYFAGWSFPLMGTGGALVGGTLGGAGIFAAEHLKAKGCVIQ